MKREVLPSPKGFTLMELMVVVAVVGILAAIAIPTYMSSVRRSYLNEVNAGFAAMKNAEEGFLTANGCYVDAAPWPAGIPARGTPVVWDPVPATSAWVGSGLNVRPDRMVRFQYQVYASNAWNSGCGVTNLRTYIGVDRGSAAGTVGCVNATNLIPISVFPTNWYVLVARGDLNGNGFASNIVSVIDDSAVIYCNELE